MFCYLVCIILQYVHTALLEKNQIQNLSFTTSSVVNLSCFVLSGSKCTWVWDSAAEKSAAWKNCSVLWLLERSTWKDTLNIHGIHAWGKQESSSTSAIGCVQCYEHPSIQLCISAHRYLKLSKLKTVTKDGYWQVLAASCLLHCLLGFTELQCFVQKLFGFGVSGAWQCLWKDSIIISKHLNLPEF